MKLAVVSDIHGRADLLRRALTKARELGCDRIVCAGDVLDDGPEPLETLEILRAAAIPCVRGNHERWALERGGHLHDGVLTPIREMESWLQSWPKSLELSAGGVRVAIHHGSPRGDMDCLFPDAEQVVLERHLERADADILVVGHTHVPFVRELGFGRLVVNAGTLGAPGLGQRHTFALVEVEKRRAEIIEVGDDAL